MKSKFYAGIIFLSSLMIGCAFPPYIILEQGSPYGASVYGGAYNIPAPYVSHAPSYRYGSSTITQEVIIGGGFRGYGGCHSVSGWEYNRYGYPVMIPPGRFVGNCPQHHHRR